MRSESAPRLAGLVELRVQAESKLNHFLLKTREIGFRPISTVREIVPSRLYILNLSVIAPTHPKKPPPPPRLFQSTSFLDLPRLTSLTRTTAGIILQAIRQISYSHCIWENDSYSSMVLWFLKGVTLDESIYNQSLPTSYKIALDTTILDLLHISKPSRHLPPHYVVN